MAKQPKTETNTPKVPEAELVGDHANAANGGKNAGADSGAASVPATATGEATAPVATSSTDTTASGSGDAAGTVTTGLVKPQEAIQPTTAIPAGADQGTSSPEVEASTSGTSSTDTPRAQLQAALAIRPAPQRAGFRQRRPMRSSARFSASSNLKRNASSSSCSGRSATTTFTTRAALT